MENNSKRYKELETVDRERGEIQRRKEKEGQKKMTVIMANLTPDDTYNKKRTTSS